MRTNGDDRITYSNGNGHAYKSPAEIEKEIQATRIRMEHTLQAIKNDLSPGQIVDQALHYFKDGKVGEVAGSLVQGVGRGASTAASSVGLMVKQNPLPAALIGAGLVWMAANSWKAKHPSAPKMHGLGESDIAPVGMGYGESASLGSFNEGEGEYGSSISSVSTDTSYSTSSMGSTGSMQGVGSHEHGRMHGVKSKLSGAASSVKGVPHAMKHRGQAVKTRASHLTQSASERARIARERGVVQARRAKDGVQRTYDENPLVLGAVAVGVGALLGVLVPLSSRENMILGKKRDDLVRKADELGAKTLEKAKGVVDQGVEKLKQNVQSVGNVTDVQGQAQGTSGSSSFESSLAPTTGGMYGSTAYGTSSVNPTVETSTTTMISTTAQAAPLPIPEDDLSGSTQGPVGEEGPQSDFTREREVGGMEPSSIPPKGRGPGF